MATHKKQVNSLYNVRFFPNKNNSSNKIKARSPAVLPSHRQQQQRRITENLNYDKFAIFQPQQKLQASQQKPQLSRSGTMGIQTNYESQETSAFLQEIENDIQSTEVETISIDKLQKWRKTLVQQCELLEKQLGKLEIDRHQYAFRIVPHTEIIEKQIIQEMQNRDKLQAQTNQMIKYQEQEISQLLQKIQALQDSLKM